jgi:hypothetical protein
MTSPASIMMGGLRAMSRRVVPDSPDAINEGMMNRATREQVPRIREIDERVR